MRFEWDDMKSPANKAKHGLSFYEAQDAYFDKHRMILLDKKHSSEEKRYFVSAKRLMAALPPQGSQ